MPQVGFAAVNRSVTAPFESGEISVPVLVSDPTMAWRVWYQEFWAGSLSHV